MTLTDEIIDAALRLPETDRFQLVTRLVESFPNDGAGLSLDDPDLIDELDRRFHEAASTVPLSQLWDKD